MGRPCRITLRYAPTVPIMARVGGARPAKDDGRATAGLFGVAATVALVVAVVFAEFMLLSFVYHRGDDVRSQRLIATHLTGALQARTGERDHPRGRPHRRAATGCGRCVRCRSRTLADGARERRSSVADLRADAARLSTTLGDRSNQIDVQADLIYIGLLIVASLGWMVWFRRLVARHKGLQRRVTEHEAARPANGASPRWCTARPTSSRCWTPTRGSRS